MTIDKERLRVLAEAATGWSNCDKVWPHAEYDEISVLGAICEEGVQYPGAEIDADTYGDDGDSLKLAQFYAGANPAAVLALLSENAALAAEVERLRKDAGRVDAYIKFMRDNAFNPELHAHETRDLLETCKRLEEWRSGIND